MKFVDPWKSYRQVATQTATPGQLVLMLYDGAIKYLDRALTGFSMDDPGDANQTINNNVQKAQDIIQELNYSLNMQAGGEFAVTMRRLYDYMDERLQESNMKKQPEGIQEVIARITVLRDAWATMLQGQCQQPPMPGMSSYQGQSLAAAAA